MKLLTVYLKPYWKSITVIFFLVLVRAITNLYLPTLNADIINKGVVTGDTGYIWRVGGYMLGVTVLQIVCTIIGAYLGAKVAMAFGRDVRSGSLPQGGKLLPGRDQPLRHAFPHHARYQRRAIRSRWCSPSASP